MTDHLDRVLALATALLVTAAAAAEDATKRPSAGSPTPAQIAFFEKNIRPVLAARCYSCHSDATKKPKGGLRLDTREGLRQGGASGPALVPGVPRH